MNGKRIFQISGVCAVAGIITVGICYLFLRGGGLGKLSEDDANELFKNSKIKNDSNNKNEVTGVRFFKYVKKFLDTLDDHMVNSACTSEVYDGKTDKTKKGSFMKEILVKEVKKIMFGSSKAKEEITDILKSKNVDEIIKDQLGDKKKAKPALAKAFIYNMLKTKHDGKDYEAYKTMINDDKNKYFGEHLKKFSEEEKKDISIQIELASGNESMTISKFLYSEMYLMSGLIPSDLFETKSEEVKDMEKKHNDAVDAMKKKHEGEIADREKKNEEALADLRKVHEEKLNSAAPDAKQSVKDRNDDEFNAREQEYNYAIETMKKDQEEELANLKKKNDKELADIKDKKK